MNKWKIANFLTIGSLMIGCGVSACDRFSEPVPGTASQVPDDFTNRVEMVETPTLSHLDPTPSTASAVDLPTPMVSPTVTSSNLLPIRTTQERCLDPLSPMPTGFLTEGVIFLGDFSKRKSIGNLMTLHEGELHDIPGVPSSWGGNATSPDGQWLLYETADDQLNSSVIVLNADGEVQTTLSWEEHWGFHPLWLDNERLLLMGNRAVLPESDILNPFTGHLKTISPSLPDLWTPFEDEFSFGWWGVSYDPTLARIAYMAIPQDTVEINSLVLWDLESNQEIWRLRRSSTAAISPVWSPDASRLAVVALNEYQSEFKGLGLYLVSRDSLASPWIQLDGYFTDSLVVMKWSPNGRYIAIAPVGGHGNNSALVLDTVSQLLFDYCLKVDAQQGKILWSPDSTQVILPNWDDLTLVLDIEREAAAYVVEDPIYRPLGWLKITP